MCPKIYEHTNVSIYTSINDVMNALTNVFE